MVWGKGEEMWDRNCRTRRQIEQLNGVIPSAMQSRAKSQQTLPMGSKHIKMRPWYLVLSGPPRGLNGAMLADGSCVHGSVGPFLSECCQWGRMGRRHARAGGFRPPQWAAALRSRTGQEEAAEGRLQYRTTEATDRGRERRKRRGGRGEGGKEEEGGRSEGRRRRGGTT
eukprot:768784-Hanusia_phi.AAC.4